METIILQTNAAPLRAHNGKIKILIMPYELNNVKNTGQCPNESRIYNCKFTTKNNIDRQADTDEQERELYFFW